MINLKRGLPNWPWRPLVWRYFVLTTSSALDPLLVEIYAIPVNTFVYSLNCVVRVQLSVSEIKCFLHTKPAVSIAL